MTLQIRGADASMTEELEELGAVFSHRDRTSDDPFAIMAAEGATLSRLRLWVDPYDEDDAPSDAATEATAGEPSEKGQSQSGENVQTVSDGE